VKKLLYLIFILPLYSQAQTVCDLAGREKLDTILEKMSQSELTGKTSNELVLEIAPLFLKTPYVEKTLELPGIEKLVINLIGIECTTYLETVATLVRIAQKGEFTFHLSKKSLEISVIESGLIRDTLHGHTIFLTGSAKMSKREFWKI
jgi:hypothetical protein